jgi:hypothetical protein
VLLIEELEGTPEAHYRLHGIRAAAGSTRFGTKSINKQRFGHR